jgi:crotonobetainyl-CoA:carnitine CoA-transferase CaiB-like acyl-CoA transferase
MAGVRVLEVAQFTFVPAAGALLADWGADVIKVEHAVMGDAQRGTTHVGSVKVDPGFSPLMEHPNRGKRSIGLALEQPGALEVLYELARSSDVFLTNFLPDARRRLRIDVDDIRAVNPDIIYVRGSAFGAKGPDAEKGGYDFTAYWCRGGGAGGATPDDMDAMVHMPAPAYGDSIGGMTIAGGISAALFARERTGETSVLDISLLSVGAWANALAVDLALVSGQAWRPPSAKGYWCAPTNPLSANYRTSDGRWIAFHMSQLGRYWEDFCRHLGRLDLLEDPRLATTEGIVANTAVVADIISAEIGTRTLAEWAERMATLEGAWAVAQDSLGVAQDAQLRANGYIAPVIDADGNARELVTSPVQFDETPPALQRGPLFAEHTDQILRELGRSDDEMIELKIAGAVT